MFFNRMLIRVLDFIMIQFFITDLRRFAHIKIADIGIVNIRTFTGVGSRVNIRTDFFLLIVSLLA